MPRALAALAGLLLAAPPAAAHFVFILPDGPAKASVVFSDTLGPDEAVPVEKIADTTLYVQSPDGGRTPLAWVRGEHAYTVEVPGAGERVVAGVTDYGVFQRGENKPMRLTYYPKLVLGPLTETGTALGPNAELEIVPSRGPQGVRLQVLHRGKPLAGAEVTVLRRGSDAKDKWTTDADGRVTVKVEPGTVLGALVNHKTEAAGEHKGKKYEIDSRYATLVVAVR
jgi:uncharacterized GH25 family protein